MRIDIRRVAMISSVKQKPCYAKWKFELGKTRYRMYIFTGHETFPCRYSWLPKAYNVIGSDPKIFSDEDKAIVSFGIGKNMVRSLRFWVKAADIAIPNENNEYVVTDFGRSIFSEEGFDPFLEDIRTLWLIHWKFSTHVNSPLFAWDYLFNRWHHPEITPSDVLFHFQKESVREERNLSSVTLKQHFQIFLNTYVPTGGQKGDVIEDNLDCPLIELELIQKLGERQSGQANRETIYGFRREDKPDITPALFNYCVYDFWEKRRPNEKTLSLHDISVAHGSPGQIFKIPEWNIRERLEEMESRPNGVFGFRESVSYQHITRSGLLNENELLKRVYTHCDSDE